MDESKGEDVNGGEVKDEKVKGVFLHSKKLDSDFMVKCLQMLLNHFPQVKINSVVSDELHFGYRVHFSFPDEDLVLERKHLLVHGENVRIGPLRTSLTIHGVQKNGGGKFEAEIRENIWNKFGKLLNITAVSNPEDELTKNLRAFVDVPEIEELEIFNREGSSDMFVCLPNSDERLKVTFYCLKCDSDGHAQQNCTNLLPRVEKVESISGSVDSKDFSSDAAKPFPIRLESPNSYAEKIGREEILKTGILSEGNQNEKENKPEPSFSSVKVDKVENTTPENFPFVKIKQEIEDHDNHTGAKNSETLLDVKRLTNSALNNEVNKDSNDDDVQVIECRDVSNSSNSRHSFTFKSENKDEEADSNDNFNSAFTSSSSNTTGPSARSTPAKPITAVEVTKILSPQLQACINKACEEFNILDRNKLDAFLIHVKKKSNPLRIASNYTNNAGKLKDQLQKIITLFYNTPQAGTKDDTQFIKWLTGLVERFEGTIPKKRKRSDHSDSPRKK